MKITIRKIYILSFIAVLLWFSSKTPYLNLIISPFIIFFFIWLVAIPILKISGKINILFGIFAILSALPWLMVGNRTGVEDLGIFAFLAILIGIVQESLDLRE